MINIKVMAFIHVIILIAYQWFYTYDIFKYHRLLDISVYMQLYKFTGIFTARI